MNASPIILPIVADTKLVSGLCKHHCNCGYSCKELLIKANLMFLYIIAKYYFVYTCYLITLKSQFLYDSAAE